MGRVLHDNGDPHSCGTGFWFLNALIFLRWEVCLLGGQEGELYPLGHAEFSAQLHPHQRLCSATLDSRVFPVDWREGLCWALSSALAQGQQPCPGPGRWH